MADFAHPEVLVSTDWVAQHASDPNVRIVEVDVDTKAWDEGHVPGAIAWAWNTQLADQLRRDILSKEQFEQLFSESGIGNDSTLVLYGDNNNWFAAWAFWQAKIYGHKDVRIMNGGRKKWLSEGRELETGAAPAHAGTSYKAAEPDLSLRAFLPQVEGGAVAGCDARRCPQSPGVHRRDSGAPGPARDLSARRPHSRRSQHPVEQSVQRGRHFQERRGIAETLRRRGRGWQQTGDRLLPHRRTIEPHLVRAEIPARV